MVTNHIKIHEQEIESIERQLKVLDSFSNLIASEQATANTLREQLLQRRAEELAWIRMEENEQKVIEMTNSPQGY